MVADEVVVEQCVEIEVEALGEAIAETYASEHTGIEATVLAGEGTLFVKINKVDIVVSHAVCGAVDMLSQPVATEGSQHEVTPEGCTPKGKVGHEGQSQIGVVMIGINR